jgi:Spy/CpxP family protein refolding chaperone
MTMELVRAEKKSLPSSTFQVPAGYTKAENPMAGMGGGGGAQLPKEVQDQIREKLSKLTPEQRKQLEEAMKAQGAAAPH